MLHSLARFLEMSPDGYHAVAAAAAQLREAGFQSLEAGSIEPGGQYYCTQGGAALLAFRVPADRPTGFVLTGSHGDSPCFRLRGSAEISGTYTRLSAERYGGLLPGGWLDRPLGVAGRVLVRTEGGHRGPAHRPGPRDRADSQRGHSSEQGGGLRRKI